MSKEAATYYQDLFRKVYNSPKWQDYLAKKSLQGEFLTGNALMEYWVSERNVHEKMLKNMGVLK
jgi:tripartite-type tricarboxylate transporter receptor subunit TctC